jgi:hypothetical protein
MIEYQRAKAELSKFLSIEQFERPSAVTLTMKKRFAGERADHISASTNFGHFKKRLNAKLLGSSAKRYGHRLKMAAVIEANADDRLHYHAIIDRPAHWSFTEFKREVYVQRQKTNFGYREIDVQDTPDEGWTKYMLNCDRKRPCRIP